MKERPIIFSGPMVRAILNGRKTQTRRVVKCLHELVATATGSEWDAGKAHPNMRSPGQWKDRQLVHLMRMASGGCVAIPCPYGQPGDRLWVRETWAAPEGLPSEGGPHGRGVLVDYAADYSDAQIAKGRAARKEAPELARAYPHGRWRPSIHMPRWASRITLEVTGVRVERLQEISEADAVAEGVDAVSIDDMNRQATWSRRQDFSQIWDHINAKRGHGWDTNPWVWVVEFKTL